MTPTTAITVAALALAVPGAAAAKTAQAAPHTLSLGPSGSALAMQIAKICEKDDDRDDDRDDDKRDDRKDDRRESRRGDKKDDRGDDKKEDKKKCRPASP